MRPSSYAPPSSLTARSNLQTGGAKTFGLQLPKSKQLAAPQPIVKPRAFAMDDDDEEDGGSSASRRPPAMLQLESVRAKRYAADAARVLSEDPNAFNFDDMFDADQAKRAPVAHTAVARLGLSASAAGAVAAAPAPAPAAPSRYISDLLSKSASRKLEQESVYERNLLKERAKDDAQHVGKEKYVTSAYKAQLEEQARIRRAQEEQDRRDEALEAAKRRGGIAGTRLAMMASRNMLEGLTGNKRDETHASTSALHTPPAPPPPVPARVSDSHARPDHTRTADEERAAKRPRLDEGGTGIASTPAAAAAPADFPAPAAHAAAAPHTAPAPTAPSVSHADAVAAVATRLTASRDTSSKAEEARARLAARKAAAAAAQQQ